MSQDRATLRQLAESRLAEAKLLLANGLPSGAYYLAGYAIEFALKAIIAGQFRANEIPDRRLVERIHVHDLVKLMGLAGLESEMKTNPDLQEGWATVINWSERARYELWTPASASAMIEAIDGEEGLLEWLLNR